MKRQYKIWNAPRSIRKLMAQLSRRPEPRFTMDHMVDKPHYVTQTDGKRVRYESL